MCLYQKPVGGFPKRFQSDGQGGGGFGFLGISLAELVCGDGVEGRCPQSPEAFLFGQNPVLVPPRKEPRGS
jgi:hypothetical protein